MKLRVLFAVLVLAALTLAAFGEVRLSLDERLVKVEKTIEKLSYEQAGFFPGAYALYSNSMKRVAEVTAENRRLAQKIESLEKRITVIESKENN